MDQAYFFFLVLAYLVLWIRKIRFLWPVFYCVALVLAITFGSINFLGIIVLAILFLMTFFYAKENITFVPRTLWQILSLLLGFSIFLKLVPGFSVKTLYQGYLSPHSSFYQFGVRFSKASVGIFFLYLIIPLAKNLKDWKRAVKVGFFSFLLLFVLLFPLGLVSKMVWFDLKWPPIAPYWILANLIFTCASEEAFFRGFLQKVLMEYFYFFRGGDVVALILTSVIFGLYHFAGGVGYILLSSIAGLIYGYAYLMSNRIEAAIICHFLLNFTHFIFFTYPFYSA